MEIDGTTCTLCPRRCGVARPDGFCGAPQELEVASVCLHRGEEPPLSGTRGIVNVFFAHCNLQCIYCQNWQISEKWSVVSGQWSVRCEPLPYPETDHRPLATDHSPLSTLHSPLLTDHSPLQTDHTLVDRICSVLSTLHSPLSTPNSPPPTLIGFVTAAHYIDRIPAIVEEIRRRGISPTIVYNSGGYESVEALRQLEGYVDIYLPDLKYMDADLAARYSHAPDYPEVATEALREMRRQVGGGLKIGDDGLAYRGMLVRHLVLPGAVQNAIDCLDWLADNMPFSTGISLMAQYFPPRPGLPTPLDRQLTQEEYDLVLDHLETLPFNNVWTQDLSSQSCYRPDFDTTGNPFERS